MDYRQMDCLVIMQLPLVSWLAVNILDTSLMIILYNCPRMANLNYYLKIQILLNIILVNTNYYSVNIYYYLK